MFKKVYIQVVDTCTECPNYRIDCSCGTCGALDEVFHPLTYEDNTDYTTGTSKECPLKDIEVANSILPSLIHGEIG